MMPEENRVFDVARPGRTSANPTSKPVIVGHHPMTADPMVNETHQAGPTHIMVQDSSSGSQTMSDPSPVNESASDNSIFSTPNMSEPMLSHENEPSLMPGPDTSPSEPTLQAAPADSAYPAEDNPPDASNPSGQSSNFEETAPQFQEPAHVEGLRMSAPKRRSPIMKIVIALLILLVAVYLLIDSGVVKTGINLPFHIFKQKTPAPAAQSSNNSSNQAQNNNAVSLPPGFTEYKLADTNVTFAAPTAWGTPSSSTDQGFTSRGTNAKSDGTHAYTVDFATNKDVEIAVTAAKYLPPARATQYYDLLQWCTGTNDGKIYEATLRFNTSADKVDTPSTITCDQGPVDAIKLDSATIVQAKVKSTENKVIGDIYTKNLNSKDLPVFRVKDASSSNSDNIKQVLSTVRIGGQ